MHVRLNIHKCLVLAPLLILIMAVRYVSSSLTSLPLMVQRDFTMGSYQVSYAYTMQVGSDNQSVTVTNAPNAMPNTINYRVISSLGSGADYAIGLNTISLSIEVQKIDIVSVRVSFYTDFKQNWMGFLQTWILIIDQFSPVYPYIMPSILRINNPAPPVNQIITIVSVSTFSTSPLILTNDLAIYSFIAGFVITSANSNFQFGVDSTIVDSANIRIVLSYTVVLTNIAKVRIDTVVIDKSQLPNYGTPLLILDFQVINCPTDPFVITYAQLGSDHVNMMVGLRRFGSFGQTNFYLQLWPNPSGIYMQIGSITTSSFSQLRYNFLSFVNLGCQNLGSTYFFDSLNNVCQSCSTLLTTPTCLTCANSVLCTSYCHYTCLTCSNTAQCTSCNAANKRTMHGVTHLCNPMSGFFDDGTNNPVALPCTFPCVKCSGTAIYCIGCSSLTYYLDSVLHQCHLCNVAFFGCLTCGRLVGILYCNTCDGTKGLILATDRLSCNCASNSYLDTFLLTCHLCSSSIPRCQTCNADAVLCTSCQLNFFALSPNNCVQVCGDGFLYDLQCDDGNLINGDGCDSTCHVQSFYSCSGGSSTTSSVCQINIALQITIISYLKDQNKNKFYLDFSISPALTLTNTQLSLMLVPNFPTADIHIDYNPVTGICQYDIEYDQPLDKFSNMEISFSVSSSRNLKISLSRPTDNNLALKVYSSQTYDQIKALVKASRALCYLFLVVFVVGWFTTGKQLLAADMIFILQYAYSGLFTSSELNLSLYSFKQFAPLFGIVEVNTLSSNYQFSLGNSLPTRFSFLGFELSLIQNINTSLVLLPVIAFCGGLAYFIGQKLSLATVSLQGKKIALFWTFSWMMLIQFPLMTSVWILLGNETHKDKNLVLDIVCASLYGILYIGICVYLLAGKNIFDQIPDKKEMQNQKERNQQKDKKQNFDQSSLQRQKGDQISQTFTLTKQFKWYFKAVQQQRQQQQINSFTQIDPKKYFFAANMLYKMLLTVVMVFLGGSQNMFVHPIIIIMNFVMLIFLCRVRPYKNNFSPIVNSIIIVFLTVPYLHKQFNEYSGGTQDFFQFWGVLVLIVLLYVSFFVNSYFLLKETILKVFNFMRNLYGQHIDDNINLQTTPNKKPTQFTNNTIRKNNFFQPQAIQVMNKSIQNLIQVDYTENKVHKRKKKQKREQQKGRQRQRQRDQGLYQQTYNITQNTLVNVNQFKQQANNNNGNDRDHGFQSQKNNQAQKQQKKINLIQDKNTKERQIAQQPYVFQPHQNFDQGKYVFDIEDVLPVQNGQQVFHMQQTITTIKEIGSESHILDDDFLDFDQGFHNSAQKQEIKEVQQKPRRVRRKNGR